MSRGTSCQFVLCLGTAEKQGREKWGLISVCDMCKIWSVEERERGGAATTGQGSPAANYSTLWLWLSEEEDDVLGSEMQLKPMAIHLCYY